MSNCIRCREAYDSRTLICEDCEQAMHEASTVAAIVKALRAKSRPFDIGHMTDIADYIESLAWRKP